MAFIIAEDLPDDASTTLEAAASLEAAADARYAAHEALRQATATLDSVWAKRVASTGPPARGEHHGALGQRRLMATGRYMLIPRQLGRVQGHVRTLFVCLAPTC